MLSKQDLCKAVGERVAIDLFASMLNPKYRGKNFDWNRFPDMCEQLTKSQVHLSTSKKLTKKDVESAMEASKREAIHLMNESGILDWWDSGLMK